MTKLERWLKKLKEIRDWYWSFNEEDKVFKEYLNNKYEIYNKVCWMAELFVEQWYEWEVEWLTDKVFLRVNEWLEDNYTLDKWLFARALRILEWDEESLNDELNFIDSYSKAWQQKENIQNR